MNAHRWSLYLVVFLSFFVFIAAVSLGCKAEPPAPARAASPAKATLFEPATPTKNVFKSPLAGSWYEADPGRLASEIDSYLKNVDLPVDDKLFALILPHAGLRYSGQTAAYGIKQIAGRRFTRVVILGPSHHVAMNNFASVPDADAYSTPLGETPLDVDFIRELKKSPYFRTVPTANGPEHSVQIALPLLQRALKDFRFVPVVVGQIDLGTARAMAAVLLSLIDENTLVIASSDFTHYGPNYGYVPFQNDPARNLNKLDMGAFAFIEKKDLSGFDGYIKETGATICGRAPISVLLAMLPPGAKGRLLHYDTSGAMTHDFTNSVSYVSAAFDGTWAAPAASKSDPALPPLSSADRKSLIRLAKSSLEHYLEKGTVPAEADLGIPITPGMKQIMGAFVTLTKGGRLRGCIGEIEPMRPLYQAVMEHAIDAAVHDPRFPPVRKDEYKDLFFEISALTPSRPIASYKEIVIGKHGVVLHKGMRSAVFLPQVAPEEGWNVEQMLYYLSMKAGLPGDAWRDGATFTVFEAIVFDEKNA